MFKITTLDMITGIVEVLVIIPGVGTLNYRLPPHNLLVIKPQRSDIELYIANL